MFTLAGSLHLTTPSRLPENACCPNKDLVLLITGDDSREKLIMLNMEGSKKWETEASEVNADHHRIMGVAWSPDGGP
jgi:anaphase-promoting complex subunit 4